MIDLRCGDARAVLATLEAASVDSVITDPPYALTQMSRGGSPRFNDPTKPYGRHRLADKGFMGQQWDNGRVAHDPAFWAEVLRVAKPGAFLLAFGGTRTYHRLASAVEDGGWELRDMIVHWMYASGFPKSKSCLKPSHEPIVLAKAPGPLQPLQIDAARVPTGEFSRPSGVRHARLSPGIYGDDPGGNRKHSGNGANDAGGRWPPNTLLSHHPECRPTGVRRVPADKRGQGRPRGTFPHSDDAWGNGHRAYTGAETAGDGTEAQQEYRCVDGCPVAELDRQAGPRTSGAVVNRRGAAMGGHWHDWQGRTDIRRHGSDYAREASTGSASRYFPTFPGADPEDAVPFRYQPKAPPSERRLADGTPTGHPTQKPVALAQWLASLVCAPGGTILDPFAGVGSLGVGALRAGCHYLGIEQDAGYAAVAQRRLDEEQERKDGQLTLPLGHACG